MKRAVIKTSLYYSKMFNERNESADKSDSFHRYTMGLFFVFTINLILLPLGLQFSVCVPL